MKTLKGSILDNIETTMANGDKMLADAKNAIKNLRNILSKPSNWDKTEEIHIPKYSINIGGLKDEHIDGTIIQCLLQKLGFDDNNIYIYILEPTPWHIPDDASKGVLLRRDNWCLNINLSKITNDVQSRVNDVISGKISMDDYKGMLNAVINTVYIPKDSAKTFNNVIKDYIVPALRNERSFKKFLNDIGSEKNNILR